MLMLTHFLLTALLATVAKADASILWRKQVGDLELVVSRNSSSFALHRHDEPWLESAPVYVRSGGTVLTVGRGLTKFSSREFHGHDGFGHYEALEVAWSTDALQSKVLWVTAFRVYDSSSPPAVVFEQQFPNGLGGMAGPTGHTIEGLGIPSSAFPVFKARGAAMPRLGYLSMREFWDVDMTGVGLEGLQGAGIYGGVPLVLYDQEDLFTAVVSPAGEFKNGVQARLPHGDGDFACGTHGRLAGVPRGWSYETVLTVGPTLSVTSSVLAWGNLLLQRYSKPRFPATSTARDTLTYFTDTGAYYWYHPIANSTYEETMVAVRKYHQSTDIPVQRYEIDSWWYYKFNGSVKEAGALTYWYPRPDAFPEGMPVLRHKLGDKPLTAHAKLFATDTVYARQNGGKWDFDMEAEFHTAIPRDRGVFDGLMANASAWGITVWQQDWLAYLFEQTLKPGRDVHTLPSFFSNLTSAAERHDVDVQFCMPLAGDVMQTLVSKSVKYIRVSYDYCDRIDSWKVARPALVAHALGVYSFKDVFWSTSSMPGYDSMGSVDDPECWTDSVGVTFEEGNSALQAAASILSAGPVAFGDMIEHSNRSLLLRTCMSDGTLLHSNSPALPDDRSFRARFPGGEIWRGTLDISGLPTGCPALVYFVANTTSSNTFGNDLDSSCRYWHAVSHGSGPVISNVDFHNVRQDSLSLPPMPASMADPWHPADLRIPFALVYSAPTLSNGWVILGEAEKFITLAPQRFLRIVSLFSDASNATGVEVEVAGAQGEEVEVFALNSRSLAPQTVSAVCSWRNSRVATFQCRGVKCSCSSELIGSSSEHVESPSIFV